MIWTLYLISTLRTPPACIGVSYNGPHSPRHDGICNFKCAGKTVHDKGETAVLLYPDQVFNYSVRANCVEHPRFVHAHVQPAPSPHVVRTAAIYRLPRLTRIVRARCRQIGAPAAKRPTCFSTIRQASTSDRTAVPAS